MNRIAVLIPCYNEELTIARVVTDFRTQLPEAEIYVYDNNSTNKIVKKACAEETIIRYEYNQSKGNVIKRMFRKIDAKCYITVDGDDTYSVTHAKKMASIILKGEADMVIGDRLSGNYFKNSLVPRISTLIFLDLY